MPLTDSRKNNTADSIGIDLDGSSTKRRQIYHVVFDGVQHEMETIESFAIKFGLLTNMPVTKIRHMTKKLPSSLWSGHVKSKAVGLLNIVEEAGGIGRLVIEEPREPAGKSGDPALDSRKSTSCVKCGFPLKNEDDFCQFCLTPLNENASRSSKTRVSSKVQGSVSHARLLFYLLVLLAGLVITLVSRM